MAEDCMYKQLRETIGWSKAPDWATHYGSNMDWHQSCNFWYNDKYYSYADDLYTEGERFRFGEECCMQSNNSMTVISTREKQPAIWDAQLISKDGEQTTWTAKHYDNYYQLTEQDIEAGKIKVDAYFVSNMWKLGEKDNTGVLFHNLKTIARFGDKNDIEREIRALYNQTKRLAELHGVKL